MDQGTAPTDKRPRIQGLDVLRGAAVLSVMMGHAWPQTFGGAGIVGVVLFFVLSGYLITQVLQREITDYGRLRWERFYAHRFFRLFPALALMLAVVAVVLLVTGSESPAFVGRSVLIGALYLGDLPRPYFEPVPHFDHLWTLSVEEQFYFVWPWLLLFAVRIRRVGTVLAVCAAVSVIASIALPLGTDLKTWQIYKSPTSWCLGLVLGAGARLYVDHLTSLIQRWTVIPAALTLAGVAFIYHLPDHPELFLSLGPAVALASVVLVLASAGRMEVSRAERPLVLLGGISYGAYLWNVPLTKWWRPEGWADFSLARGLLMCVATIGCAVVSWFTAERLGRAARSRYDLRQARRSALPTATLRGPDQVDVDVDPASTALGIPPREIDLVARDESRHGREPIGRP